MAEKENTTLPEYNFATRLTLIVIEVVGPTFALLILAAAGLLACRGALALALLAAGK